MQLDLIFIRLEGSEGRFQLLVGSSHSHPFRSALELLEADRPSLSSESDLLNV